MAIEDAASIAQVLTVDTAVAEVSDRLKLYERIRRGRASWIQEQTRINGMDEDKRPEGESTRSIGTAMDVADHLATVKGGFTMLVYCNSHDEWSHSSEKLQEWLFEKREANGV
jgi:2-polyprenyl-6-methoxyphenol hydroxylase-like FAD-dependent oxidoreductase